MKLAIFTTLLIEKSPQALPLGAACCASAVKHNELTKDLCKVQLCPFNLEDPDLSKIKNSNESQNNFVEAGGKYIAEKLLEMKPDIVAFSVFVWNRLVLEKAAAILKEKGILTLAGGPEITAHPEIFTVFDRVIPGEGENTVPPAIYELLTRQKAPLQKDLPAMPLYSPYLDETLNPAEYEGALWELARGCPFKCSYCYESKGQKLVRTFPMDRIEKELDLFAKKKIPQVFVLDPTYNANKKRAIDLINLIAKKTPHTFYYFEARAEFIDNQLARAFTKIPCALQIGLQSANENVCKLVNRPFNRKNFEKGIRALNQEGVIFGLDVIYGLPGDSLKGFKESIDFAINLYPNNLELFCLSVLPGTDLFDKASDLHLNFEKEPPYHIINTDRYSKNDIENAGHIAKACSFFYNEGRAVPWFNTICHALKTRPSQFFERFYNYLIKLPGEKQNCCNHKEIEEIQKDFVKNCLTERKAGRLANAALDIISFNGAMSRKTDTGISEVINLHYPLEYIESEYSLDLEFFAKNVRMKNNRVKV